MRDFTGPALRQLLETFLTRGYAFQTFAGFTREPAGRVIILRHDVDKRKLNSLNTALLEKELGITGTYYFRVVPSSFDEKIIREIASMGHEIGYHYEDLALAGGDEQKAISLFGEHLDMLRGIVPVETICMHGSPLSRYDNRHLWKNHDYRRYGIIGEPYFDLNFDEVLYLTDTGRRWNGEPVSVRDKNPAPGLLSSPKDFPSLARQLKTSFDIIRFAENNLLPDRIMLTLHPQRWDDRPGPWLRELVWQTIKNTVKRQIVKYRD